MHQILAQDRLIFALDVPVMREAERLLDQLEDSIKVVKIGLELYVGEGPAVVKMVQGYGKQVFLDLKFLDIDETINRSTAHVADMGVNFLTVHAGRKSLAAAVKGRAQQQHLKILAVTVLTNLDSQDLQECGSSWSVEQLVVLRAQMASELGCDGVIASGMESRAIRQTVDSSLLIITPGCRPFGVKPDEHVRVTTFSQSIENGADYLVVGRSIRDAPDPRLAAHQVLDEMQKAFDIRENSSTENYSNQ